MSWMEVFDVDFQDVVHAAAHLKVFYHEEEKMGESDLPITLRELEEYLKQKRIEETA
jgi:hypothetical protein